MAVTGIFPMTQLTTTVYDDAIAAQIAGEDGLFRFSDDGKKLHVHTAQTPSAWENYFFNDQYYLEVDQCGQGQARFSDDALRHLRGAFRYFYLKDEASTETWNLNSKPLNVPLDSYEAVHAVGHSEFNSTYRSIAASLSVFVPLEGSREIWKVALRNDSDQTRKLSLFSVFPFEDEPLMKVRSHYDHSGGVCYGDYFPHHHAYDGYDRLKNRQTLNYLFSTYKPSSGESGERKFFGSDDHSLVPLAIKNGACSGEPSVMDLPIGALHHRLEIMPGESVELGVCYGVAKDQSAVRDLQAKFTIDAVDQAREAVYDYYNRISANLSIKTPDRVLNGFVNHWLPKQVIFQSRKNRLSGAFPIRNQLQDCMGYSLLDPTAAVEYLLTRVPLQQADGYLRQWWAEGDSTSHALCDLDFKDAGIWLILCSSIITCQSGSLELMKRELPFCDDERTAPLFEHLMRAARYLANCRGSHGLCLFGDGDWTDPINGPGRGGKGESTWTTCALGSATQKLREIAVLLNETETATWLSDLNDSLQAAVQAHCWDGAWFVTGFDDNGQPFGTSQDAEAKIFLNSQTWAIIAGYVSEERMALTLDAIRSLETKAGVLVSWPPFTVWNPTWGRISLKLAGTTENGSIYCHAGMFKAYAATCLGSGEEALREILRTLPTNPDNPPSHNLQAPIFVPNYYFGLQDSAEFGVSSRNHHTGTAPWMLWLLVEHIIGVRATPDGLIIDPKLPAAWPEVTVVRRFRDSHYTITLLNAQWGGAPKVTIDGEPHASMTLPRGNQNYLVNVTL
jgi:cellobiose phosphorylase